MDLVICELRKCEWVICEIRMRNEGAKVGKMRNRKCETANYVNEQQKMSPQARWVT